MQFDLSDAATARAGVQGNRIQVYPSVEVRSVPMRHVAYPFIGSQFALLRYAMRGLALYCEPGLTYKALHFNYFRLAHVLNVLRFCI